MIKTPLLIILLCCSFTAVAQNSVPPKVNNGDGVYSMIEKGQIDYLFNLYASIIKTEYELVNGRDYYPYYFRSKRKPLLTPSKSYSSSVTVNGRKYNGVYLNYDTFKDLVIYIDSTKSFDFRPFEVALNKDNVDSFEFSSPYDTISFRYFDKKADSEFDLKDGFYQVVYDGKSKYLIKHKSFLYERDAIDEYFYSASGYVNVGNGFIKIKSTRQFIKLFEDRSGDVKKFIKKSGIKISKANKKQIMSVLKFYDNLTTFTN